MYLKAFAEMQACLICSVCQCWLFYNLKISYWFRTVSRSAALCLSSVLHLFCLHLSPFTFLEICLILCTWNIHFLSPFQALTDVCACFLWVLVMCRGRCCVFLPAILSFFLPPLSFSVTLSRSLMRFHSLSLLCQPPLAKRANVYFKRCAMHQPPPHRQSAEEKTGTTQACSV